MCRIPRQSPQWASLAKQFALQRSLKHALSLSWNKCRVSQSTVSSRGIPTLSGSKGDSSKGMEYRACPFSSVFRSCELPLFLFSPSLLFPFSCFRCCGLGANLIWRRLVFSHHSVQVLRQDVTHPFQRQTWYNVVSHCWNCEGNLGQCLN